ncbi:hypothetical protein A2631_02320 [Candidatus Daviesbacteria bacterium RIFCSPHIGHO2_01_FULL_44_29]|nr:MAG: hypothetical protein A2631_02320 [Candidatus Daviesbacteria bacterium RIFCSPHIGHO2_01_FULL_44_29]
MRVRRKIVISIVILLFVLGSLAVASFISAQIEPPPLIVANFTDLNKIEKISKYRSCQGHVTVPQDERETKRNMKHYFWVKPEYNKSNTVEIYSPFEGYVTVLRTEPEQNLEGEIGIIPDRKIFSIMPPIGVWMFSVQHIDVKKDLKLGSKVSAGELIGYAALSEKRGNSFDIVYGKFALMPKRIDNWTAPFTGLYTVFNHMSEAVFTRYQQKGIKSKEEIIISKEERDQSPCQYKDAGPYFAPGENIDDWAELY